MDEAMGLLSGVTRRPPSRLRVASRWGALGAVAMLCASAARGGSMGFVVRMLAPSMAPPMLRTGERSESRCWASAAETGARVPTSHIRLPYWRRSSRADGCAAHAVTLALRHANVDVLEAAAIDVATPGSANYRKFWTKAQVEALATDRDDAEAVGDWLRRFGVDPRVLNGFITFEANVATIEALFACSVYEWTHAVAPSVLRCDSDYSLPADLENIVKAVFGLADLPAYLAKGKHGLERVLDDGEDVGRDRRINPATLRRFYGVPRGAMYGPVASTPNSTLALFETIGQSYSPADLKTFDAFFGLPAHDALGDEGGHDADACEPLDSCAEGNLDVQYATAIAPGARATYYYVDEGETRGSSFGDPFLAFALEVAANEAPPLVTSVSYGASETALVPAVMDAFNHAAMELGLLGGTVFVSSGDDGAHNVLTSVAECGYRPSYPASSPWVVAVGATSTKTDWRVPGEGEVVCQSDVDDSVITSGGGFSTVFDAHDYTREAVDGYLARRTPFPGYRRSGRAYPDLSLAGYGYEVVIGGDLYALSGTSCSAPTVAGMASLVNAVRMAAGAGPIGFLNPTLYADGGAFANDVTEGNNRCGARGRTCCFQGFTASEGWDPATGFGSVDYPRFEALLTADIAPAALAAARMTLFGIGA